MADMTICTPQSINIQTNIDTGGKVNIGNPSANGIQVLNHTRYMQRRNSIKYIVIHYCASTTSVPGTAMKQATEVLEKGRHLSCDFVVDDSTIVQFAADVKKYAGTSVESVGSRGGGIPPYNKSAENRNSISIETCSSLKKGRSPRYPNTDGWSFTDATLNNLAFLCRKLMKEYNIPKQNIIRHYDCSGKACPGIIGWNTAKLYNDSGQIIGQNNDSKFRAFVNSL